MKQKEKEEKRKLLTLKERKAEIKQANERGRVNLEKLQIVKWQQVRRDKEEQMKLEIAKIGLKDQEARKLENLETEILKRLRETHAKQQEAIEEIQSIFQN